MLKLVRCMVLLQNLPNVVEQLQDFTSGMTVWQTKDLTPETMRKGCYRGYEYQIELPRAVVEIVTDESWVDDIIRRVPRSDCRIDVFPVEASYHVRNGFMEI
jgi:nitrogen regulatory protein PII